MQRLEHINDALYTVGTYKALTDAMSADTRTFKVDGKSRLYTVSVTPASNEQFQIYYTNYPDAAFDDESATVAWHPYSGSNLSGAICVNLQGAITRIRIDFAGGTTGTLYTSITGR